MQRPQVLKDKLQDRFAELKTLRDEIRVDLRLANMELKSEWKELEKKIPDPATAAAELKQLTSDAIEKFTAQLRGFRFRLGHVGEEAAGQVQSLMSTNVTTSSPADSLAQAVTLMWNQDVGCLPVLDAGGKLLGVITDRDAAIAACTRGSRMEDLSVESAMSKDVTTCMSQDRVEHALGLMRSRQVRRLPVVNEAGVLVGLVTLTDIARAGAADPADVVTTLATVTDPRGNRAASIE